MTMTRKEWFEEIVARVQNPQNKEKREKQRNNKNGYSLDWHLARARELFNQINTSDEQRMSLLENDFDVSIKGYLILIIAGRYLALLCAMLIIYFLSAKLKSVISTFLAATAVLILPILLALLGLGCFDYVLLYPILIGNI